MGYTKKYGNEHMAREDPMLEASPQEKPNPKRAASVTNIWLNDRRRLRKVRVQLMTDNDKYYSLAGTLSYLLDLYETQRYGTTSEQVE
jgi:hypothetical protein